MILSDKVMRFNPYLVSDDELLACAARGYWRPFPALTQMVIFHFLDIRTLVKHHEFDAIFYRVGNSDEEHYFPLSNFIYPHAHHSNLCIKLRSQINGRNIIRSNVSRIQNRSFFVSHAISSQIGPFHRAMLAFRMYRLRGNSADQANTIRTQMCQSKIAMLQEVMSFPESPLYLGPGAKAIDYLTPIRNAMASISRYPNQIH